MSMRKAAEDQAHYRAVNAERTAVAEKPAKAKKSSKKAEEKAEEDTE